MLNGILLIDKVPGWTSHDVVAKCRGLLRERRIGHGGTLDPMATGLLVLFVGPSTKLVSRIPGEKTYIASLKFGCETDTYDSEGQILRNYDNIPSADELRGILPAYTGDLMQVPPMVSAVKIGGKKLYDLARKGIEVERPPRPVTVHKLTWLGEQEGEHKLLIECSAGTYVRALIHEIGHKLGSGAVMTALRRTHSGPFCVDDAVPVEQAAPERIFVYQDTMVAGQTQPSGNDCGDIK